MPVKILAFSGAENTEYLTEYHTDQSYFGGDLGCVIEPNGMIILDFGKEYSGGVKMIVNDCGGDKNGTVRIRFGESASEASSEPGLKGQTNDHSVRDQILSVAWVSQLEYGNTGYRFIRIDNVGNKRVSFRQIFGVYVHSGLKLRATFSCSDERLNKIWETGVRTVYLNMQEYVYDGIKRDRVVWIGDMHPETSAISRLFGDVEAVRKSLDFVRDHTAHGRWMNDIPSYTCWWIKIHRDWYWYGGDKAYLAEQTSYLKEVLPALFAAVNQDGSVNIDFKFIDWPSSDNSQAQDAGLKALLRIAFLSAKEILEICDEKDGELIKMCDVKATELLQGKAEANGNKQAAALMVLAGLASAKEMNEKLFSVAPYRGVSTFLGYYLLCARAEAGDLLGALDLIRVYWGAMLDLGATTFWEDFNLDWTVNAKPIDEMLENGEYDVHGDNGAYCYSGFRHSLCHGWASGPVPFLSEYVLGAKFLQAGGREVLIMPKMGDLDWAEGKVPTPLGDLWVRHERTGNKITTKYVAPNGITVKIAQ